MELVFTIVALVFGFIAAVAAAFVRYKKRKEIRIEMKPVELAATQPPPLAKFALPEGIPAHPAPYFAHPYPLQENFTGRVAERKELTEWFTKGAQAMLAYVAIGGMGKSALTWFWVQEDIIKRGLAPEGIMWWSFHDKEARFETFLMKAIQYVSKGEIDPKGIDSTRDRMETLNTLLSSNRFLLVLDGVERVLRAYAGLGSPYQGDEVREGEKQDFRACVDPNVGTFLQWLASGNLKTKTLLTSRLVPKELDDIGGCIIIDLRPMDRTDAVNFFLRQGVKGTRVEIESACELYGYHPLSLRLLSSMIMRDPKFRGDILSWTRHNPLPDLKGREGYHILELTYNSLDPQERTLISKLSAFRNPMGYDSISIFNEFETEKRFDDALIELVDRGLLLRDIQTHKYDLHPIVRKYCYDRLTEKEKVHSQLRDYFAGVPKPEKFESLDDLAPIIELYYHTVSSGQYDRAIELHQERLSNPLYFQFGAYQAEIDLLRALFPDGEDKPPRLKKEGDQAWTLSVLANCYSLSGRPKKAVRLLEMSNQVVERLGDKLGIAIGLGNLALMAQIPLGELKAAERTLQRSIDVWREMRDGLQEATVHQELGRLLAYEGKFEESNKELAEALELSIIRASVQSQGATLSYRALLLLLMSEPEKAFKAAQSARELADVEHYRRDIIWAEWLLGAAYLAIGDLRNAEEHLNEALVRDRKINLVELEPDILLELAKLRFKQGHKEEALKLANEALGIADRSEYRLKQADIHNFLTEFYLNAKDFVKAKEHVEVAKERAKCGYVPAMKKAEELSQRLK